MAKFTNIPDPSVTANSGEDIPHCAQVVRRFNDRALAEFERVNAHLRCGGLTK